MRACVADELPGGSAFMAAEVVGDDHVAGGEGRDEALRDPGGEHLAIDRPVQHEGRDNAVVAQPGEEGQGLPVPMRDMRRQPLAPRGPAAGPGHVGLDPGFINEDQASGVEPVLMRPPSRPEPRHLRTQLFTSHQGLFF